MRFCEGCEAPATKTCSSLDQPELHFCDKCYEKHLNGAHHGVPLPGAPVIDKRQEAITRSKKKKELTLLEQIVWDALKQSQCPPEHRYIGPSQNLPCRWCRTAHAVILVLRRMEMQGISPRAMIEELERQVGWKLP